MRRVLAVSLVGALGLGACGSGQTEQSSTSLEETTTTTVEVTTTTAPTTTSPPPPSSTTSSSSTTTTQAGTTTSTVMEGNWADEPLIVTDFGALGWWDGADWIMAEEAGELPVVGGEEYQVARIGLQAVTTAGPQTLVCEPLQTIGVEVDNPELLGQWPGPFGVAISAPWELQPHVFESISDDGTYAAFASELLSSRGVEVANPPLKQLFRTDLEGDGVNEVLAVVEDVEPGLLMAEGDYSIAFLRKVVAGEVQTAVLGETVIGPGEGPYGTSFTFGAVADLNGDAKMEMVLDIAYYEGLSVAVFEYVDDDLGPLNQLEVGCGS